MKIKIYSRQVFFFMITSCILFSCDKNEPTIVPQVEDLFPGVHKIYCEKRYSGDELTETVRYEYLQNGNLSRIDGGNNNYTTLTYCEEIVTINRFFEGKEYERGILTLNIEGLAISEIWYGFYPDGRLIQNSHRTFEYDNNGYLIKEIFLRQDGSVSSVAERIIDNGNTVEFFKPSTIISDITIKTEYLLEHANSLGSYNIGISFYGTDNLNLVGVQTSLYESEDPMIRSFEYEFDRLGRVFIKKDVLPWTGKTEYFYR